VKADESYTLVLIPDARSASRKVRIPVRLVRWAPRVVIGATIALAGLLVHYTLLNWRVTEMEALRAENASLCARALHYEVNIGRFEGRIASLRDTVTKLGIISGVEQTLPADGAIGGLGGVSGSDWLPPSRDPDLVMRSLSRSLSDLDARSTRIASFYVDQQALLARTPSIWPVRGYLSSAYGRRRDPFSGGRDFHPGIDISAPRGTKVLAPADGVVVSVGRRRAYGKAIIIDHGHDTITRYGHLQGYNVRPGQRVRRGDVIGFVGNTGRSKGPHLHYEVWVGDKTQNPIHYILEEYRSFG
jgi:murein DD-endopeptidase MepM/ murein hydrolase activator NlpD